MTSYRKFNDYLIEKLHDPEEAMAFLTVSIEDYAEDHDTEALMLALRLIAEAQGGIHQLSLKAHLNRQNLYKILTGKTIPRFDTALSIINGLGFQISLAPIDPSKHLPAHQSNTPC